MFEGLLFPSTTRVYLGTYNLEARVVIWWENIRNWFRGKRVVRRDPEAEISWDEFTRLFMEQYIGDAVKDLRQTQFDNLAQNNMTILDYENEFDCLVRHVPQYHGMEEQKARRFIRG